MTSRCARLLPLLLLSACGARTFITEEGEGEGSPLGLGHDAGAGRQIRLEPNSPTRPVGVVTPQVTPPTPPVGVNPPQLLEPPPPAPVMINPAVTAFVPPAPPPPPEPVPEPVLTPTDSTMAPPVVEPEVLVEPVPEPAMVPEPVTTVTPEGVVEFATGNCDAPTDLGSAMGTVATGSNADAVSVADSSCGASGGREVVFRWVAPASARYVFDTYGSNYDTTLVIHASDGCFNEVTCNDDGGGVQSLVSYQAEAGEVLTVVLDGFSESSVGDYLLQIEELVPEDCEPVDLGSSLGLVAEGQLINDAKTFTQISGECGEGERRIPYKWTAPRSGQYHIETLGSDFDTVLVLRDGCGLPMLECNDDFNELTSRIDGDFDAGQTLLIELSMFGDNPSVGSPGSADAHYELSIESGDGTSSPDAGAF